MGGRRRGDHQHLRDVGLATGGGRDCAILDSIMKAIIYEGGAGERWLRRGRSARGGGMELALDEVVEASIRNWEVCGCGARAYLRGTQKGSLN